MTGQYAVDGIISSLSTYYRDLGEVTGFKKLDKGQANENYEVQTLQKKYFLKIIPPLYHQAIARQLSFYNNIGRSDLKTIQPIANIEGGLTSEINSARVIVYPFEMLTEPSINSGTAKEIGELVARLHMTSIDKENLELARYSKRLAFERLELVNEDIRSKYHKYIPHIRAIDDGLPKGFVFDDVCTDNIYSLDGEMLGFIDPENAGYGEFIYDIAGALTMCFFEASNKFELCRQFLQGYEKHRIITDKEKNNLFEALFLLFVLLSLFFELQPEPKNHARISLRLGFADSLIELGKEGFNNELFKSINSK